jgi:hypothetical protein
MDDPSSKMHDPMRRTERYRNVAAEYDDLADGAASPFFEPTFYSRVRVLFTKPSGKLACFACPAARR